MTRRDWLIGAACAGAAAVPYGRVLAQPSARLGLLEIGPGLAVVQGTGANVTVRATADGLLLVDGGLPQRTAEMSALLRARWPDKPVRDVFNTNWRYEHTGANEAFRSAGARIHAHENTKLWMGARFEVKWQQLRHTPRPADALPSRTFYDSGRLELDGADVRYGHLPRAHTDGDVYVHFPDENVFVVSDLLSVESYPIPDYETGGWIGGMVEATRSLLEVTDDESVIIPAEGGAASRRQLESQLALCEAAMKQAAATYRAGGTLEDYLAANPTDGLRGDRGDPTLFLSLVYEGGYYHSRELGGII